jgi:elongation factor Ts
LSCPSDAVEDLIKVSVKVNGEDSDDGNDRTIKDAMDDAILSIRENLQIVNVEKIVAKDSDSVLAGYVHGKVFQESNAGTAAALVELKKSSTKGKSCALSRDEMEQVGKRLAMHIVAAKPVYLAPEDVPEAEIEKERQILMEQMADSGKPADILEKIVNGRMRKYYEEVCLLEQSHMLEEGNPKVSKLLAQLGLDLVTYKLCFVQK